MKERIFRWIDDNSVRFADIAGRIWERPELGMQEHYASGELMTVLEKSGFDVERDVAGMPTAFIATYGTEGPVLGLSAEYDALSGLSQKAATRKESVVKGGPGHGCGHNILGTGAVMAAVALKNAIEDGELKLRIRLFGTPAEELCIGKPFMGRAGAFKGVDFFLDWHPLYFNRCNYDVTSAYFNVKYHFTGKSAHGNMAWMGRSALDAACLTGHAIEMLREHIPPGPEEAPNSINYTYPDVGGDSPGVIPENATIWVIGRAISTEVALDMQKRVDECARAGAIGSGCTYEKEFITATHEAIPNRTLSEVMHRNFEEIGVPQYSQEDIEFVKALQAETGQEENGISKKIPPCRGGYISVTDATEYTWNAPYATTWIAAGMDAVMWHNWTVTACMGTDIARKVMTTAAKIITATAVELGGH